MQHSIGKLATEDAIKLSSSTLDSGINSVQEGVSIGAAGGTMASEDGALQKGLLWQQRDRLFSRWKQRYFVLTRDYLNCFRKASSSDKVSSDMGQFIFKVKLVDVDRVEWINKRNYSMIALHLGPGGRDGRILLRAAIGLPDWMESLEDCCIKSKKRREMLRMTSSVHDCEPFLINNIKENPDSATIVPTSLISSGRNDDWLLARRIAQLQRDHSDSVPDISVSSMRTSLASSRSGEEDEHFAQRHSLLTNIDMNTLDSSVSMHGTRTPSRQNNDIFFMTSSRQRASIATPFSTSQNSSMMMMPHLNKSVFKNHYNYPTTSTPTPSLMPFRLPNMLHTTRGTANRYSFVNDSYNDHIDGDNRKSKQSENFVSYSTYDSRILAMS